MTALVTIFIRILHRIGMMFCNIYGWLLMLASGYVCWLGTEAGCIELVLAGCGWDLLWGVAAAIKQKNFVLSRLLRETFVKIFVYVGVLTMVLLAERNLNPEWSVTVTVISTIAFAIELFSASGNILIVKPNFPFVSFFGVFLVGEIADKMKISKEEAKAMLKGEKKDGKN